MSVVKLLSRIVAPDVDAVNSDLESTLHDYTYGITSDPLTQFACVFSALIHDVDHPGVPNTQLVVENPQLAKFYKDKSVAEQNSVDLSWDLLQDSTFNDLRLAICPSESDRVRFRQPVVNSVMATDIMDKDLKTLRNKRWEKAFAGDNTEESAKDAVDRKATIVIEHLIQASDVAHTMLSRISLCRCVVTFGFQVVKEEAAHHTKIQCDKNKRHLDVLYDISTL